MASSIDHRLSNRVIGIGVILQGLALAALVWLRPPVGLYLQMVVVAVLIAGAVGRYRCGMRDYRRMKAQAAGRRARPVGPAR